MILAPIPDPLLLATVRRAALPDEDVLVVLEDARQAARFGLPRLLVCREQDRVRLLREIGEDGMELPVLSVTPATVRAWEAAWHTAGLAVSRVDDSALRLRRLMGQVARSPQWVDGVFMDLTRFLGAGLPGTLKGFFRRTLEFPARYTSLAALEDLTGLSGGALKARFRRRGLVSPVVYMRWLRILVAGRFLSREDATVLEASFRLGFTSDGNFCRWVRSTTGLVPSDLRKPGAQLALLIAMADQCFPEGSLDRWSTLGDLFLSEVA